MPRFGNRRRSRGLGQTETFDPNAAPVPGTQYALNFSVAGTTGSSDDASTIQSALQPYPLFANGALTLIGVSLVGTTLTVTIQANSAAASVTLGGIEAAMASWFNNSGLFGQGPSGFTLTPTNAPGLGVTTFTAQLNQTPTPTVGNTLLALLGQGPALPNTPSTSTPWWVYAGLAVAGVFVLKDHI